MEFKQWKRLEAAEAAVAPSEGAGVVIEYDPDGPRPEPPPGCRVVIYLPKPAPLEKYALPPETEADRTPPSG